MGDQPSVGRAGFDGFVAALIGVIGHADRAEPLRDYCLGLMMSVARKSVEPLAAVTTLARVSAQHQSLLHFVGQAPWSDSALMAKVRDWVLPRMVARGGRITVEHRRHRLSEEREAFGRRRAPILRPTRQAGQLPSGGQPLANAAASLPIATGCICPRSGPPMPKGGQGEDPGQCRIPDQAAIALDQIRAAQAAGIAPGVVLADGGYGVGLRFVRASACPLGFLRWMRLTPLCRLSHFSFAWLR